MVGNDPRLRPEVPFLCRRPQDPLTHSVEHRPAHLTTQAVVNKARVQVVPQARVRVCRGTDRSTLALSTWTARIVSCTRGSAIGWCVTCERKLVGRPGRTREERPAVAANHAFHRHGAGGDEE